MTPNNRSERNEARRRRGPRRPSGQGSISRRGKGWRARLFVDGRRVELYAPTKAQAYERLHEALRSRSDSVPIVRTLRYSTEDGAGVPRKRMWHTGRP